MHWSDVETKFDRSLLRLRASAVLDDKLQQGTMWHFRELQFVYVGRFVIPWVLPDVNKSESDLLPFGADQASLLFWKRLQFRRAAEGQTNFHAFFISTSVGGGPTPGGGRYLARLFIHSGSRLTQSAWWCQGFPQWLKALGEVESEREDFDWL